MTPALKQTGSKRLVWGVWAFVSLLCLATVSVLLVVILSDLRLSPSDWTDGLSRALLVISYALVGGMIVTRFPRHAIGWLLVIMSAIFASSLFTGGVILLVENGHISFSDPIGQFGGWLALWNWIPQFVVPMVLLPLYYPTGRLLSRQWRIVSAAALVGMLGFIAAAAIGPAEVDASDGFIFQNPFEIADGERIAGWISAVTSPLLVFAFLGTLVSMFVRYRRAGELERLQMKWLFFPVSLVIIWWLPVNGLINLIAPELWARLEQELGLIPWLLVTTAIPLAIAAAILRYRLYDIDLIIRRTLVYGVVTAALAAVYFGSVLLLQQLSAGVSGEQSPAVIVLSTLLIAALFSPLRRRAQQLVDRRFYRAKYDAAQTLAGFAQAARNETDLAALTAELLSVVQASMQPETCGVWLRPQTSGDTSPRRRPVADHSVAPTPTNT